MPLYLSQTRGWDLKQIALFAWLPFLAADIGCLFGGTFSLWLQKYWHINLINARRAAFTLGRRHDARRRLRWFVESPYAAIALLSLAGFRPQTLSVTVITMSSDLFKKNEVATVAGMAGTLGNAGLLIFSLLIGALVLKIGYTPFFICLGLLDVIGAVILWTVVKADVKVAEAVEV
jgi:ACS family hexuronate transporter-like MFS transporter